jgi:hypothetical protein
MTEEKIKSLLQSADNLAPQPSLEHSSITAAVFRRAHRRKIVRRVAPVAAAAILLAAVGIQRLTADRVKQAPQQDKIASLEMQIQQLQERTDATLKLIREVLDYEQKQRRLNKLKAELARTPDPLEQIEREVNKTAFILVYQADRMYREFNQVDSAVQSYNRVIELFPETPSAITAKQRLSQIRQDMIKENKNSNI